MNTNVAHQSRRAIGFAILSAALYALYPPIAKVLVVSAPPAILAALLYLGTGIGMTALFPLIHHTKAGQQEVSLSRADIPALVVVIITNIFAGVLMNVGIKLTSAGNISLLSNFEIVATTCLALVFFHEHVSHRLAWAIGIITVASLLLSVNDVRQFSFSWGAIFAILATICWGFENNLTRVLSDKDPLQIVIVKGWGVGLGSMVVSVFWQEKWPTLGPTLILLLLGFFAFGVSIYFYILAQRYIGAAKTSAYYAVSPFIAVLISIVFLHESLSIHFVIALLLMVWGSYLITRDTLQS
ncbi:DMT family transporter [Secundilactobacillus silagei]|uniref:DMT superfamily transporter inner membrane protein n=1 Tax=Secundilactobacillus silagei JCM 19001 TaxID=1302250 RepID=A0A1Z5IH38_9LACO|nr:DMT family transporter [Secundilactobacillus silagei]TDG73380.1 hypothetical protein C5L25_000529 [Secundilactobacillus silagei JCM 19001]GAX00751.1 putative DMT superfamily transporter inner membrane protein [Secundilactobacillus silagei JCM 19001]